MLTFREFIEGAAPMLEPQAFRYISPDDMMYHGNPEITFIYTPAGQVIATDGHTPHNELVFQEPEYRPAVMGVGARMGDFQRKNMIVKNLLGRIGTMGSEKIACFWNSPLDVFNNLISGCLKALEAKGYIGPQTRISAPTIFDKTVGEFMGGTSHVTQANPETQRIADLSQQMHLMRGDHKKAAMKQVGVGMPYRPNPWTAAMQKNYLSAPGWKLGISSEETLP